MAQASQQAAGMKLLSALTGRPESFWRPTSGVLLSRAMQDFRPMPQDDRAVKRHAVHDGDSIYTRRADFLKSARESSGDANKLRANNPNTAYRLTGQPQIDDMVRSGQVRPKEGKIKGGSRETLFWSKGSKNLSYGGGGYVIEADAKISELKRPLSLDEVRVKTQTKPGVWQDITDQVRSAHRAYKKQLSNLPRRAANAARGDAAFAGPASARSMADDSFTYGLMGGTLGAIPSGFVNNAVFRPTPTP